MRPCFFQICLVPMVDMPPFYESVLTFLVWNWILNFWACNWILSLWVCNWILSSLSRQSCEYKLCIELCKQTTDDYVLPSIFVILNNDLYLLLRNIYIWELLLKGVHVHSTISQISQRNVYSRMIQRVDARLTPATQWNTNRWLVSMCTLSVQYCSACPNP